MWFMLSLARAYAFEASSSVDALCYRIGAGDELRVDVVGEEDMSGVFRVAADGTLEIPHAKRISVADHTAEEAAKDLTAHLAKDVLKHPQVLLKVETYASKMVDVDGGVAKPGSYAIDKCRFTVSDLLVKGGGLADGSAPLARIIRNVAGEENNITVDLEKVNAGDPEADKELRPGDRLYVPPSQSVYVDGQVQKPGAIAYRDNMTVTQAIAQGGGMLSTAKKSGVYIMRGEERIPVNVKRILSGEEADIALRPSDRIYIPESVF